MFCDARVSVQKLGLEWTDVMSSTEARSPAFALEVTKEAQMGDHLVCI